MENRLLRYLIGGLILTSQAHAFSAKDVIHGDVVHFPDPHKKALVLVFLSARCPCSQSHQAKLKKLFSEYEKEGFEFVGVHSNQDEDDAITRTHFEEAALPFPVVSDPGAKLANEFKALKTPHAYVVQTTGAENSETRKVLYQGGVDDSADASQAKKNYLEEALSDLRAGRAVKLERVRTLGCAIKRS